MKKQKSAGVVGDSQMQGVLTAGPYLEMLNRNAFDLDRGDKIYDRIKDKLEKRRGPAWQRLFDYLNDSPGGFEGLGHPFVYAVSGATAGLDKVQIVSKNDLIVKSVGEVLFKTAALNGLTTKAFFRNKDDRHNEKCEIRFVPSPLVDLPTVFPAVSVESLDKSLKMFSTVKIDLNLDRVEVQTLINYLTKLNADIDLIDGVDSGRYHPLEIIVSDRMKSRLVSLNLDHHVSLTRILDEMALRTDGQWFWYDLNKIKFKPRYGV